MPHPFSSGALTRMLRGLAVRSDMPSNSRLIWSSLARISASVALESKRSFKRAGENFMWAVSFRWRLPGANTALGRQQLVGAVDGTERALAQGWIEIE